MVRRPAGRSDAVVIGAGIAGLTVAKALADRFERVTVLDRDALPDAGVPRRGVPQGRHPHTLLLAGQRALGTLFPGLHDEMVGLGATVFDSGTDLIFYRYGSVWPRIPVDVQMITLSRPLLEVIIRRRVAALPNITVRDGAAVSGLTLVDTGVAGVVLDDGERLAADLVVDCSGRGSRSDRWLASAGFPAPPVVEVKVGVGYASRLVRRQPTDLVDGRGMFVLPTPPHEKRMGVVLPVEDDQWLVGVGGWHGQYPPADEAAFVRHARSLPYPAIADLLEHADPTSEIATHQFPSSRWRRFERLRHLPAGYLAVGDAICSFNPVYGQGMTCAAMEAVALGRTLDRYADCSAEMARAFYRAAAGIIATPWRFAVGADFMYPETSGRKPPGIDLVNGYSRRMQLAARHSIEVRRTFVAVQHLIEPATALFTPPMIARVLRGSRPVPGVVR